MPRPPTGQMRGTREDVGHAQELIEQVSQLVGCALVVREALDRARSIAEAKHRNAVDRVATEPLERGSDDGHLVAAARHSTDRFTQPRHDGIFVKARIGRTDKANTKPGAAHSSSSFQAALPSMEGGISETGTVRP